MYEIYYIWTCLGTDPASLQMIKNQRLGVKVHVEMDIFYCAA